MALLYRSLPDQELDLNVDTAQVEFDVSSLVSGTVAIICPEATWGTAVVTLYRSHDGLRWFEFANSVTLGPGDAMTDELEMSGYRFLAARVTTVEGGANRARVSVQGVEDR
jgi:hypothetical protein